MQVSKSPIYYGWLVLAASAMAELLAQGATSYAAGLFVLPLQAEFHISRADANSSVLLLFLGSAVAAPLVGRALDRWPIRLVVPVGALLFGGALAAIAHAPALWMMALALLVPAAIGFMAIGPLTTSTLAARWFHRRRGLAMGIAAIATSGGGLIVVPLLGHAIQSWGWRVALFHEAWTITAIILVLSLLVLRDNPAAASLQSHPENQRDFTSETAILRPSWQEILSRRAFWIPSLMLANISGTCQAVVVTIVPYGVQLGIGLPAAALFISAFALAAAVTKIAAGLLADWIEQYWLILAAAMFMIVAQLTLCLAPNQSGLLAASTLSGVALGCALPTTAALIAGSFGPAAFGAAMGWTYALVLAFAIVATRFIGAVYDATHSYVLGFATFLVLTSGVLLISLLLRPRIRAA